MDGNEEIGLGHVMRCLSVADAFAGKGEACFFILADGRVEEAVKKRGYKTFIADTRFDNMEAEVSIIPPVLRYLHPKYIVVDSYFVTEKYLRFLREFSRVAYIDDLAAFAYPVDSLINYNIYSENIDYVALYSRSGMSLPDCILGTKYVPLREEFGNLPMRIWKWKVKNILISTGGADPLHLTLRLVKWLAGRQELERRTRFHIVLGAMNRDTDEIMKLSEKSKNMVIHPSVQDMRSLMLMCDLAVSAAGSTLYELCACGTPAITFALADNQLSGADAFHRAGIMISLGDIRADMDNPIEKIMESIWVLSGDLGKRKEISQRMQGVIDGNGAKRIAEKLLSNLFSPPNKNSSIG